MKTKVRCKHCEAWIPAPARFEDMVTFDRASMHRNILICQSCGESTRCSTVNMRAQYVAGGEEGGFVGIETT